MGFKDDVRCSRYADADVTSDIVDAATTICAGEADVLADTTDALASSGKLVLILPQKLLLLLFLLPLCCWCCCLRCRTCVAEAGSRAAASGLLYPGSPGLIFRAPSG